MPTLPKGSIQVEHVWKKFRADRTAPLFYDQLVRVRRSITKGGVRDYRWVLKDVSVNVEPGGTLGLIGINGSGKTTLLKIISGTRIQSAGSCQAEGRLGRAPQCDQRNPSRPDRARERVSLRRSARHASQDLP